MHLLIYIWAGITCAMACYWFTEINKAQTGKEKIETFTLSLVLVGIMLLWPILPIVWLYGYYRDN